MENIYEIDPSRMFEKPKCAVHCPTIEDARSLVRAMKIANPAMARNFNDIDCGWEDKYTCYTLFYEDSVEPTRLSRTEIGWFRRKGYEVIECAELAAKIVDIEESDQAVDTLFG